MRASRSQIVILNQEIGMKFDIANCDIKMKTVCGHKLLPHRKATNMSNQTPARVDKIGSLIRTIRGEKIILDDDLAGLYGVEIRVLNQAVKRNVIRFPGDFMFQLTAAESEALLRSRSQSVILKRGMNIKYRPHAFTENGAIMAANILNSPEAVRMSVFVVRAFVKMRELLGGTKELAKQLAEPEKKLTARLDGHEVAIVDVLRRIMEILDPPPPPPEPPRRQISFRIEPEEKPKARRNKIA
jgi:ORF6N domain